MTFIKSSPRFPGDFFFGLVRVQSTISLPFLQNTNNSQNIKYFIADIYKEMLAIWYHCFNNKGQGEKMDIDFNLQYKLILAGILNSLV